MNTRVGRARWWAQMRYLIGSDHGWLGGIGFAAAALKLAARDQWIGWDGPSGEPSAARGGLSRFLIRPGVRCRNLASHVLGTALRRLGADFEAHFGYRPWLVETFVDSRVHSGATKRRTGGLSDRARGGAVRTASRRGPRPSRPSMSMHWSRSSASTSAWPPPGWPMGLAPGVGLHGPEWAGRNSAAPLGDQRRPQVGDERTTSAEPRGARLRRGAG